MDDLKGNYYLGVDFSIEQDFDDVFLYTMSLIDNGNIKLKQKELTMILLDEYRPYIGLAQLNHFSKIINYIYNGKTNPSGEIILTDDLYSVDSLDDIKFMINNGMDIKIFSRIKKIKRLKNRIISK